MQYGLEVSSDVAGVAGGLLALSYRGAGVPLRELALVGLTAAIITYFATGPVRMLASRLGAVAYPRERDVHVTPTPRMGGLAMFLGIVGAVFLASQLPALTRGFVYSTGMPAVLVAGAVIMGIGLIDDRWGLDALTKFAGQITAASVLVTMGVAWSVLYIPVGGVGTIVLDQASSILLTLALTVSIVNAMNFVDGLDGLAAGLGLITALAICMFSVGLLRDHGGDVLYYPPAVISVVLAGACLGFLPHNFHRAKIFMGDSGSMLIGLMLAAASTTAAGPISQNAYGARDPGDGVSVDALGDRQAQRLVGEDRPRRTVEGEVIPAGPGGAPDRDALGARRDGQLVQCADAGGVDCVVLQRRQPGGIIEHQVCDAVQAWPCPPPSRVTGQHDSLRGAVQGRHDERTRRRTGPPISQNAYGARDVFALLSPFLLVVAVMFVPMLDLLLAIVRRTRAGRSAFSPDKMHLHHRLLQIGHSHRRVVLIIYLWVGIVAFGAASSIFFNPRDTAAVMLGAIVVAGVATLIPLLRRGDDYYDPDLD